MQPIRIRNGAPGDAATIAEYNRRMAWETEHKSLDDATVSRGVARVFDDPRKGFYLVAESDHQIVGQLMVTYEWSDWRDGWFYWVQSVYVPEEHRGRGIFKALFQEMTDRAQAEGDVVGIRLYVEKENLSAQATYRRLGMDDTGYLVFEKML